MFNCFIGSWDCTIETIRDNNWEPEFVAETLEEAINYCDTHGEYDDTGWIEYNGEIREFYLWD